MTSCPIRHTSRLTRPICRNYADERQHLRTGNGFTLLCFGNESTLEQPEAVWTAVA